MKDNVETVALDTKREQIPEEVILGPHHSIDNNSIEENHENADKLDCGMDLNNEDGESVALNESEAIKIIHVNESNENNQNGQNNIEKPDSGSLKETRSRNAEKSDSTTLTRHMVSNGINNKTGKSSQQVSKEGNHESKVNKAVKRELKASTPTFRVKKADLMHQTSKHSVKTEGNAAHVAKDVAVQS